MKPPRKPPQPDPIVTVESTRVELPRVPPPHPRQRDLTPLSPMTPRPPSSAVGVPSPGPPVPGIPRSWLREIDAFPPDEAKTPTGSLDRSLLTTIVGSFHPLGRQHRLDLAEIGGVFAALVEDHGREHLLAIVRAYGNAAPADRARLLEGFLLLSEMTAADRSRVIRVARALPEPTDEVPITIDE